MGKLCQIHCLLIGTIFLENYKVPMVITRVTRATDDLHGVMFLNNLMKVLVPQLEYLTVTKVMKGMTFLGGDNETLSTTGDTPRTRGFFFFMGLGWKYPSGKGKEANTKVMFEVKRNKKENMQQFLIRSEYFKWLRMTGSSNLPHRVSRLESLDLNYVLMRSNLPLNGNIMIISLRFLQCKLHTFQFETELVYFNRLLKFSQKVFLSFCIHCITHTSGPFCCKNFYRNDLKPQYNTTSNCNE